MKIYLRIDDFPYGAPIDRDKYNPGNAKKIINLLDDSGFKYMLGVVPELLTVNEALYLDTLKNCIVCYHGFDHGMYNWRMPSETGGEFANMDEQSILQRINNNSWFLSRYNSYIFIPPFNAFTQDLLNILHLSYIDYICGGPETIQFGFNKYNFKSLELKMADKYGTIREIIPQFDSIKENDTVCLHLSWETYDSFENFIDICKSRNFEVCAYERK